MGSYNNLEEWMAKSMGPYLGAPSSTERDTVRQELTAFFDVMEGSIAPSGDTTGATDRAAINALLAAGNSVKLGAGDFYIDEPIVIPSNYLSITGVPGTTTINPTDNTFAAITIGTYTASGDAWGDADYVQYSTLKDLRIVGGLYCVFVDKAPHVEMTRVSCTYAASHGVYVKNGCWVGTFSQCDFYYNGGDAFNCLGDDSGASQGSNGNNFSFHQCKFWRSTGAGLRWAANSLSVSGCLFERNQDGGLVIDTTDGRSAVAGSITGCHFESNGFGAADGIDGGDDVATVQFISSGSYFISGFSFSGNLLYTPSSEAPLFEATGVSSGTYGLTLDNSNVVQGSATILVDFANYAMRCVIGLDLLSTQMNLYYKQVEFLGRDYAYAPHAVEDGDTEIGAVYLVFKILTMATTAARAPTVPTGTDVNTYAQVGYSLDWTFINTGTHSLTLNAATGHTLVGNMEVASGESGSFRTRTSAANTAITYRL